MICLFPGHHSRKTHIHVRKAVPTIFAKHKWLSGCVERKALLGLPINRLTILSHLHHKKVPPAAPAVRDTVPQDTTFADVANVRTWQVVPLFTVFYQCSPGESNKTFLRSDGHDVRSSERQAYCSVAGLEKWIMNLTFTGPCKEIYSYNKSQGDALFLNFILVQNSTCFGQIYCPSSGVLILYSHFHPDFASRQYDKNLLL